MKKIIFTLLISGMMLFGYNIVNADVVNLYVFYTDECEYCKDLDSFLDDLEDNTEVKDKYELIKLEVSTNDDNYNLLMNVTEYFDYNLTGVPFYIVGDNYGSGYTPAKTNDKIIKMIKNEYENEEYVDYVEKISGGLKKEEPEVEEEEGVSIHKIVYVLLGVVVILTVAVIFGRGEEVDEATIEIPKLKLDDNTTNTVKKSNTKKKTNKKK